MWGQRLPYICSEQKTLSAANKLNCNGVILLPCSFAQTFLLGLLHIGVYFSLNLLLSTSFSRLVIFNYFLVDLCILPGEIQKISLLPSVPHYILQITLLYPPLCCSQPSLPFKSLLVLSKLFIPHFIMNRFFLQGHVVMTIDMQ